MSGLLIAAVPLVGVVVARLAGTGERADRLQLVGLLSGLLGVALLVGLDVGGVHPGALLEILVVVIGYATAPVILTRRLSDLPSIPVVCASLLAVAVGYLPYAALRPPTHVRASAWWSVAVLGLVCTALAFVLFFALITAIGPARATAITYVNPAVAVLVGITLLGEDFTVGMAIGFPLILAGSVFGARRRTQPAVPEGALCEALDQSIVTGPDAVSNTAATRPVPSSDGSSQSTLIETSGSSAERPR
jgi:drug/metabolite transporter (DMT)-like permease